METSEKSRDYFDRLFDTDIPFRQQWEGRVGIEYKVPKEVGYFCDFILDKNPEGLSILELGAGDGVSSRMIQDALGTREYVATEMSEQGAVRIKRGGTGVIRTDATRVGFKDASFDVVCAFNVMHHVDNPAQMAREILRVTRKYFVLCEANGLCVPRKILELTPKFRSTSEKSYLPSTYRSFFTDERVKWINVKPFNFVFAFTPDFLFDWSVALSEWFERVPLFRWQGSSLLITGELR